MGLILSDKSSTTNIGLMEEKVNRLRFTLKNARDDGSIDYKENDRRHNGKALRKVWHMIQTAEVLADYAQRAFFALCAGAIPARATTVNAKGEVFDVSLSLDYQRGFTYRAEKDQVVPYTNQYVRDKRKTLAENEYEMWRLKEYCETTIQKRANEAVLQIHSVRLMAAWHSDAKGKPINRVRGINVDDCYNTFDRERPNYRRRHFAIPADKLSLQYLERRAAAFCDSARLVGEQAVLQAGYIDKPRHNAVLSVMSEASMLIDDLHQKLQLLTNKILKEASQYRGFGRVSGKIVQPEALTMKYAEGITLYSGRHATSVYTHEQVKIDAVRRLVKLGALTIDVPRLSFFAPAERDADKTVINPDKAKTIWQVGRKFMQTHLDNDVRATLRAYQKAQSAVTGADTK